MKEFDPDWFRSLSRYDQVLFAALCSISKIEGWAWNEFLRAWATRGELLPGDRRMIPNLCTAPDYSAWYQRTVRE